MAEHEPGTLRPITVMGYRCERCEYEWVPRGDKEHPRVCPTCKSPYWDRLRHYPVSSSRPASKRQSDPHYCAGPPCHDPAQHWPEREGRS